MSEIPKTEQERNQAVLGADSKSNIPGGGEKIPESGPENPEPPQEGAPIFNPDNQELFDRMSDAGRNILGEFCEDLQQIPITERIGATLRFCYSNYFANVHERRRAVLKSKRDGVDLKLEAAQQSEGEIKTAIEGFKKDGIPGVVESLQKTLEEIPSTKGNLLRERAEAQIRLDRREAKTKSFVSERDKAADKLIDIYDRKLAPMDKALDKLYAERDQKDLDIAVVQVRHKREAARIDDLEKRKRQVEESLRKAGKSESQAKYHEAVRKLDQFIYREREKLKAEKAALERAKAKIDGKVKAVELVANHFRKKRQNLMEIKEGKPTEATRSGPAGTTETKSGTADATARARAEQPKEARMEGEILFEMSSYISGWNSYLQEKYGSEGAREAIDQKDFIQAVKLPGDYLISFDEFKDFLAKYCKLRKKPTEKFGDSIKEFGERVKSKPGN